MESCKTVIISSQKGGVGKSTTAFNLGYALSQAGHRVLAVDFDPQANLSMAAGINDPDSFEMPINRLLDLMVDGKELPHRSKYIHKGEFLDVIPCSRELTTSEINLRDEMGGEQILSEFLLPLKLGYDYIIIDTAPSLGYLTINALAAADSVIIPVSPEYWSATGLSDLLRNISKVKRRINPLIAVEGVLLTMCEPHTILYREVKNMLDEFCSGKIRIFNTHIPRSTRVGRANLSCMPVAKYDPKCTAALAYANLAKEVTENDTLNRCQEATA